jgi:streptogramin lyase
VVHGQQPAGPRRVHGSRRRRARAHGRRRARVQPERQSVRHHGGPDGNVWFTQSADPGRIAFVDASGVVHEFTGGQVPGFTANRAPEAITTGPDGHIWFIEAAPPGPIAYIDGTGVHELTAGRTAGFTSTLGLQRLATGSDGKLWLTEIGHIGQRALGRVNFEHGVADGTVTEFSAASTPA